MSTLHNHNSVSFPCNPGDRIALPLWLQMLSCLEYMYHDLGLVKEFNMNPITLKRWLVKLEHERTTEHMGIEYAMNVAQTSDKLLLEAE